MLICSGDIYMKNLFIFLSAFIVIFLLYSLFIYTITRKNKEHPPNSYQVNNVSALRVKLSIEQIDSLSASENYKFTIANYYKDSVPKRQI